MLVEIELHDASSDVYSDDSCCPVYPFKCADGEAGEEIVDCSLIKCLGRKNVFAASACRAIAACHRATVSLYVHSQHWSES